MVVRLCSRIAKECDRVVFSCDRGSTVYAPSVSLVVRLGDLGDVLKNM